MPLLRNPSRSVIRLTRFANAALVLFVTTSSVAPPASASASGSNAERSRKISRDTRRACSIASRLAEVIQNNGFVTDRSILDYFEYFPKLKEHLLGLRPGSRWLDAGAGEVLAAEQYLSSDPEIMRTLREKHGRFDSQQPEFYSGHLTQEEMQEALEKMRTRLLKERADVVAVSFKVKRQLPDVPKLKVLQGRFLEDIPESELGRFEVITDLYGVLSYSSQVDKVLARYFEILNDGGVIHYFGEESKTVIQSLSGEDLSLTEWMSRIPGIEVHRVPSPYPYWPSLQTFTFRKTGGPVTIPPLKLIHGTSNRPPVRVFKELRATPTRTSASAAAQIETF